MSEQTWKSTLRIIHMLGVNLVKYCRKITEMQYLFCVIHTFKTVFK